VASGVEAEVDAGAAADVAAQLGKAGWDGLPARYKMVVANSVAFMVCNMVWSCGRVCISCGLKPTARGPSS
jgi:hypothetical protein